MGARCPPASSPTCCVSRPRFMCPFGITPPRPACPAEGPVPSTSSSPHPAPHARARACIAPRSSSSRVSSSACASSAARAPSAARLPAASSASRSSPASRCAASSAACTPTMAPPPSHTLHQHGCWGRNKGRQEPFASGTASMTAVETRDGSRPSCGCGTRSHTNLPPSPCAPQTSPLPQLPPTLPLPPTHPRVARACIRVCRARLCLCRLGARHAQLLLLLFLV